MGFVPYQVRTRYEVYTWYCVGFASIDFNFSRHSKLCTGAASAGVCSKSEHLLFGVGSYNGRLGSLLVCLRFARTSCELFALEIVDVYMASLLASAAARQ